MRILVLEDDSKTAALLQRGLSTEGLATDATGHGEDAVWMAAATSDDAILFGEWGKVFNDPRLAKAVVDRITHRAHIIETGSESWRFRHRLATGPRARPSRRTPTASETPDSGMSSP